MKIEHIFDFLLHNVELFNFEICISLKDVLSFLHLRRENGGERLRSSNSKLQRLEKYSRTV